MWWHHTGYSRNEGAEIFEGIAALGFAGSTIRGHSVQDATAMRDYILHGHIYQDDLWLRRKALDWSGAGNTSKQLVFARNSSTLEPTLFGTSTQRPLAASSFSAGGSDGFGKTAKTLFAPEPQEVPANAARHDVSELIRHHGQRVDGAGSHFTMFDINGGMFGWLKGKGEQFVQDIFHETLDPVCQVDMSPSEAWEKAVVLDIGSNTGFYGLLALAKGCAVVFVEPQPECNVLISQSIRESGLDERKVRRVQQPVGRQEEWGKSLAVWPGNHCSGRFPVENAERGHKDAFGSDGASQDTQMATQIPFLPVSDMLELVGLSDSSKIQLIKVDTEGNELQILEAMLPLLQSWQISNMVVEVTPMWWHHTGYSRNEGAEIFEGIAALGFAGSTIRGHSVQDATAMRDYILHGHIYQDDLWLRREALDWSGAGNTSKQLVFARNSSTLEPTLFGTSTQRPLAASSFSAGGSDGFGKTAKTLFAPEPQEVPANAARHDVSELIRHHGQRVDGASSHFTMFDINGGMFGWLKGKGEQFVQDIFHETLDPVCQVDMSPGEAWEKAVVLDIGSNTGFYGLLALAKGCAVVFVEPQPECNVLISQSIRESGLDERKVRRVQQPVGRQEEWGKSLAVWPGNHCSGRFPVENAERGHKDAFGSDGASQDTQMATQIPFLPVSDMLELVGLSDSRKIQLIKVDTEGNELQILEAMLPLLQSWQISNMVVEVTPMWWHHTGYSRNEGAEIFEGIAALGFAGSTIRGHSVQDATAMRDYILHGHIYQDDLWLRREALDWSGAGNTSKQLVFARNSSTLEPTLFGTSTQRPLAASSFSAGGSDGFGKTAKTLFAPEPQEVPANAARHDVSELIRHHGQRVDGASSHFTMFDINGGMFGWLKGKGEQFVQDIFHETLDPVCQVDMSPGEAWEKAVVLDIGSNTGFYGLLALAKGCAVVFVEPQPECNVLISQSIRESGLDERKVRRVQQPVGRQEEWGKSLAVWPGNHCSGRFPVENAERGHKDAFGSDGASQDTQMATQIPFLPVSDMLELVGLSDSSKIQLIKIDTEGNELQILEAMLPLLQSWQISNMVVEVTPMWWHHTGYSRNEGAEIFEGIAALGFAGSTIRGHSVQDATAMRDYILHGHIYQDDLWLRREALDWSGAGNTSKQLVFARNSSTLEPTLFGTSTQRPLAASSFSAGGSDGFGKTAKTLFAPEPQEVPANAARHDVSELIRHHGQRVDGASSHFTMFDINGGMFGWLKGKGEQFVQDIFHETLNPVCQVDMSPGEAWEKAVVLDIGSNTGFYGLLALAKGCAVVFVEPQPECNVLISQSIRESGLDERKVRRVQQPVGRQEEWGKSLAVWPGNHCSGRFPVENAERGHKDAFGSDGASQDTQMATQIPFLPVSDMLELVGLSDSSKIQLIKIDTEGNELQILEAMLPLLQSWQISNMVVEVTPMWWHHTGYSRNEGAEIFEGIAALGFAGSTIRGHSVQDATAMRDYILRGHIYQDDLWLRRDSTSKQLVFSRDSSTLEPTLFGTSTQRPLAASSFSAGGSDGFGKTAKTLFAPEPQEVPANAARHDVSELIRHHGQRVDGASSHVTMFDINGGMFGWLKGKGEQFVQDIFHETLDPVCQVDMSPGEAWEKAVVLDIGSNTGFYGLLALAKGCAVVFVEPQPECNVLISQSIRESGLDERKVRRVQQPVGRQEEWGKSLAVWPGNHCSGRFPVENAERGHKDAFGSDGASQDTQMATQIPFLPVSDMLELVGLSDSSKIQLIKVDTEGNELQILEAMLPLLQSWQISNMVVEVTPMWWHHTGYSRNEGAEIFEGIAALGFAGSTIRGHSVQDATAMRDYILRGHIYQDDLWLWRKWI